MSNDSISGRSAEQPRRPTRTEPMHVLRPASPAGASARPALTAEDVRRLTLYKWRYSLESCGFTADEVRHLLFLKWLYITHPVRG